jgi:hypothetical protein
LVIPSTPRTKAGRQLHDSRHERDWDGKCKEQYGTSTPCALSDQILAIEHEAASSPESSGEALAAERLAKHDGITATYADIIDDVRRWIAIGRAVEAVDRQYDREAQAPGGEG